MRANRRRNTRPERAVRSLLHAKGFRFRVDRPIRTGHPRLIRPDIVFSRARVAVFVDGCFWHGCPDHGRRDRIENAHYWAPKIRGNMTRDRLHTNALEAAGWTVIRAWEHEPPEQVADRITDALRSGAT
jgi:DNA mismatch endonuclease (patch repair protein)